MNNPDSFSSSHEAVENETSGEGIQNTGAVLLTRFIRVDRPLPKHEIDFEDYDSDGNIVMERYIKKSAVKDFKDIKIEIILLDSRIRVFFQDGNPQVLIENA